MNLEGRQKTQWCENDGENPKGGSQQMEEYCLLRTVRLVERDRKFTQQKEGNMDVVDVSVEGGEQLRKKQ